MKVRLESLMCSKNNVKNNLHSSLVSVATTVKADEGY